MRIVAIYNSKGGCGKTTTSTNLAACLAALGERTLLMDLDGQGHCALSLGVRPAPDKKTSADLLDDGLSAGCSVQQAAIAVNCSLDLLAASPRLNSVRQRSGFHYARLSAALDEAARHYRWCIIDCASSMDGLTCAALELADEVIVPVETGYLGILSLTTLLPSLGATKTRRGQPLQFRILPSMYDVRTRASREVLAELRARFASHLSSAAIRMDTLLAEAAGHQGSAAYDLNHRGTQDFLHLARELMGGQPQLATEQLSYDSRASELAARAKRLLAMTSPQLRRSATASAASSPAPAQTLADKLRAIYGVRQANGEVQFLAAFPDAREVHIAGDFGDWSPQPLARNDQGDWHLKLQLQPGRYRYRYIIDGQWLNDPANIDTEPNAYGEPNSVLDVVPATAEPLELAQAA